MSRTIIGSDLNFDEDEKEYIGNSKFYYRKLKDACDECGMPRSKCECEEGFYEPAVNVCVICGKYDCEHLKPICDVTKHKEVITKDTIVVVCVQECAGFEVGIEYMCTEWDDKSYKVMDMKGKFVWMDRSFFEVKND